MFFYHCNILMRNNLIGWGPKSFRVLNCWFQDKRFHKVVKEAWLNQNVAGWGVYVLKEKLKGIKEVLKIWNMKVFRVLQRRK